VKKEKISFSIDQVALVRSMLSIEDAIKELIHRIVSEERTASNVVDCYTDKTIHLDEKAETDSTILLDN
jgi:hypothetical protein